EIDEEHAVDDGGAALAAEAPAHARVVGADAPVAHEARSVALVGPLGGDDEPVGVALEADAVDVVAGRDGAQEHAALEVAAGLLEAALAGDAGELGCAVVEAQARGV